MSISETPSSPSEYEPTPKVRRIGEEIGALDGPAISYVVDTLRAREKLLLQEKANADATRLALKLSELLQGTDWEATPPTAFDRHYVIVGHSVSFEYNNFDVTLNPTGLHIRRRDADMINGYTSHVLRYAREELDGGEHKFVFDPTRSQVSLDLSLAPEDPRLDIIKDWRDVSRMALHLARSGLLDVALSAQPMSMPYFPSCSVPICAST